MSKLTCCKNCTDRKLFCHSTCERYVKEKALHEANRLMVASARNKERLYDAFHAERVRKTKRGAL